jgi:predicted MPP superfamily phosphohydrolase
MRITFISDTHSKHNQITNDLPGGDLLLHAGDMSSRGHDHEIINFLNWFSKLDNYKNKVFIAGNHDWAFQDKPEWCKEIIELYDDKLNYLQDDLLVIGEDYNTSIKIYGSPWQPEFFNWAFNLPRRGIELAEKWNQIPENTDILITHGPAWGYVDKVIGGTENLGCELLVQRIKEIKPKIHLCGHIHSGHGYIFNGTTHFINGSVLSERYEYYNKPLTADWNPETNELIFL